jgi:hypothetical protein
MTIVVLVAALGTALPARAASDGRMALIHHGDRAIAPDFQVFETGAPLKAPAVVPSRARRQQGPGSFNGSPRPTLKTWLWVIGVTAAAILVLKAGLPST